MKRNRQTAMKVFISVLMIGLLLLGDATRIGGSLLSALLPRASAASYKTATLPDNLLADGDFEDYAAGTVLSAATDTTQWKFFTSDAWKKATVVANQNDNAGKMLQLHNMYAWAGRTVTGLTPNTDYLFTYRYWLPAYTADNAAQLMGVVMVAPDEPTIGESYDASTGALGGAGYLSEKGTGKWVRKMFSFRTGDNTSAELMIKYFANAQVSGTDLLLDDLAVYPLAECLPVYDKAAGTVTPTVVKNQLVLTAVSKTGYLFRGWYEKGIETDAALQKTLFSVEELKALTAEFTAYNLYDDGGFEEVAVGTDLKTASDESRWYTSYTGDAASDWTRVQVSDDRAYSGEQSVKIKAMHNTAYTTFSGLKSHRYYTASFRYWLPKSTDTNAIYLNNVTVVAAGEEITSLANMSGPYLNHQYFGPTAGKTDGESWREVTISFYTYDHTAASLCVNYTANAGDTYLYLDNLILHEENGAAPINRNGGFENGNALEWSKNYTKLISFEASTARVISGSYSCKVTNKNTAGEVNRIAMYSAPIPVKKGYTYQVTATVDRTDYKATAGYYAYVWASLSTHTSWENPLTLDDGTERVEYWRNSSLYAKETKTMTYTADFTGEMYYCFSMVHGGTVYFDDFKVEEIPPSDVTKTAQQAMHSVGTAIRLQTENIRQGIRCKMQIDKRLLSVEGGYGMRAIEYGMLAIRDERLSGSELVYDGVYTHGGKQYAAGKGVAYALGRGTDVRYDETATTIDFTSVLVNISESNYTTGYTARAYMICLDESGGQHIVYSDPYTVSIYEVAKAAYSAKDGVGNFRESKETREYFHKAILSRAVDHTVSIQNGQAPLTESFRGVSATVYHCFTFMKDWVWGRQYTDAQAGMEMDRLQSSGIKTVRSFFSSHYAWDDTAGAWDWDSEEMQAVYKWAGMLQERDIEIGLQAGYDVGAFVGKADITNTFSEAPYLYGEGAALYGEETGITLSGTAEEQRLQKASYRYGEWMSRALLAFRARGYNNVTTLFTFVEPAPSYKEEWLVMLKGLNARLTANGIRQDYLIVGPNQTTASTDHSNYTAKYFLDAVAAGNASVDDLDVLSTHTYPSGGDRSIYEESLYYDQADKAFSTYMAVAENGGWSKEFWVDETFVSSASDGHKLANNGMAMTQFAAVTTSAMNRGISRVISWQLLDQLWVWNVPQPDNENYPYVNVFSPQGEIDGDQFACGVHLTGTAPTLPLEGYKGTDAYNKLRSYTPRILYYGLNLLGRHLGYEGGSVYRTTTDAASGLYVGTVERSDGKLVILVANTSGVSQNLSFEAENSLVGSMTRYTYDPASVTPTADATPIGSDLSRTIAGKTFYDTIGVDCYAIYIIDQDAAGDVEVDEGLLH